MNGKDKNQLIKEVMYNYPEAGAGNSLQCEHFDYDKCQYVFVDEETGMEYEVNLRSLRKGLDILLNIVEHGQYFNCGRPPCLLSKGYDWDGQDNDALVQCAIFGEIIYG